MKPNIKKSIILAGFIFIFVFVGVYSAESLRFQGAKNQVSVLDVTLSNDVQLASFGPDNFRNIPVLAFDLMSHKRAVEINSITLTRTDIKGIPLESEFVLFDIENDTVISNKKFFIRDKLTFRNLNLLVVAGKAKTIVVYADILHQPINTYSFSVSIGCRKDITARNIVSQGGVALVNDGGPNPFDIFNGPNTDRSVIITIESSLQPSDILDSPSYGEFYTIKEALDNIEAVRSDGSTISGTDLVRRILDDGYNPEDSISDVDAFMRAHLDGYTFPLRGHRSFIANIVNGLWVEYNRLYPWSFADYSFRDIRNLFIEDELVYSEDQGLGGGVGHFPGGDIQGMASHGVYSNYHELGRDTTERGIYRQFKLEKMVVADAQSHEEAALALIKWTEKNFLHAYYDYTWEDAYEGGSPAGLDQVYEQRIIGCHIPTLMLESFFHSMNIPAKRMSINGHGVIYLSSIEKFIHGDHIANFVFVPPEDLLLSREEIEQIGSGAVGYSDIIRNRYDDDPAHYFVDDTALLRDGDALYLFTEYISLVDSDLFAAARAQVAPEFDLVYDSERREVYSTNRNPILSLEELSE